MSNGLAGFEAVSEGGANWNPKSTGSKKGKDFKKLEATDKSYFVGWYLGTKSGVGENNSNVHSFRMKDVGDKAHITGDMPEDKKVSMWGSGVLDGQIADNIAPGQCVAIVWEGIKTSEKSQNNYHAWKVMVNNTIEPINVNAAPIEGLGNATTEPTKEAVATEEEAEDDMPF